MNGKLRVDFQGYSTRRLPVFSSWLASEFRKLIVQEPDFRSQVNILRVFFQLFTSLLLISSKW